MSRRPLRALFAAIALGFALPAQSQGDGSPRLSEADQKLYESVVIALDTDEFWSKDHGGHSDEEFRYMLKKGG